jgi:hypothetical protein
MKVPIGYSNSGYLTVYFFKVTILKREKYTVDNIKDYQQPNFIFLE